MSMFRVLRVFLFVILVGALVFQPAQVSSSAAQQDGGADPNAGARLDRQARPTDQIIIKFREPAGRRAGQEGPGVGAQAAQALAGQLSQAAGVSLEYVREMSGGAHVYRLPQAAAQAEFGALIASLEALPEVLYAEPDAIMLHTLAPNDPQYGSQWHYKTPAAGNYGINLPPAWDITTGTTSVVVAVIDTGITTHPDLSGRTVPGYDFIGDTFVSNDGNGRDNNPADPGDWYAANECGGSHPAQNSSWHGTHVAGTIAANSNNGVGVAGVNWNAKILPVRVLGKCGGYTSDIADGMRWSAGLAVAGVPANANPAKVLNLSLGGSGACSATYQSAVNAIVAAGKTVVVAAGNSNQNASGFQPANCSGVITVSATNRNGSRSYYSNYGSVVEVSAPGGETNVSSSNGVLSTLNSGTQGPVAANYVYYQGTSMAAPHVAGVVSLLYAVNPALTPAQVLSALQTTVTPFPGGSTCNTSICGSGIANAAAALQSLSQPPPPVCTNLIKDPGFEAYTPNSFWAESSTNFGTPLCTVGDCTDGGGTAGPRSGSVWGWFGGTDATEESALQQAVVIPPGDAQLEFYLWIGLAESGSSSSDVFRVKIDGTTVFSANATQIASYNSYKKVSVGVSSFANNGSHTVRFEGSTSGEITTFNLDDVSLCVSAAQNLPYSVYMPFLRK